MTLKIHILFQFVDGPWGGGNQFLKSLRKDLTAKGIYAENPEDADAVVFNSHHCLEAVIGLKRRFPEKAFIHRVDGPVFLIRGRDRDIDDTIFRINAMVSDGTIFQSRWSRDRCLEQGMSKPTLETVVVNAPDPTFFYPPVTTSSADRRRLVATSWSSNAKKGFDIYKFLDENLDFSRYEMSFIGNSPCLFKNIRHVPPLESSALAEELRRHDIFITASVDDPCSNSLIEALHCGLPAVARSSGGHPEIVGTGGRTFDGTGSLLDVIDEVSSHLDLYRDRVVVKSMADVGGEYASFVASVVECKERKRITSAAILKMKAHTFSKAALARLRRVSARMQV